jgi:hypothetical protein
MKQTLISAVKTRAPLFMVAALAAALTSSVASRTCFALDLDVLAGMNVDNPSITVPGTPDLAASNGYTGTIGAFMGLDLIPGFMLETGLQYLPRKYTLNSTAADDNYTVNVKYYMVPAIVRFTLLPIINVGVGPYYARGSSVITSTGTINGQPNSVLTSNFSQGTTTVSDWGVVASVQAKLPILPFFHLTADARYLLGMENVDASGIAGQSTKYRDWQLLFGAGLSL